MNLIIQERMVYHTVWFVKVKFIVAAFISNWERLFMGKDFVNDVEGQALYVNKEIIFHWWFIGNSMLKNCTMSKMQCNSNDAWCKWCQLAHVFP